MNTCSTCCYWKYSIHTPSKTICDTESIRTKPSTEFEVFADADDDTNMHTELRTGPNFGCVHHEMVK